VIAEPDWLTRHHLAPKLLLPLSGCRRTEAAAPTTCPGLATKQASRQVAGDCSLSMITGGRAAACGSVGGSVSLDECERTHLYKSLS
jgi:hypothetical protein